MRVSLALLSTAVLAASQVAAVADVWLIDEVYPVVKERLDPIVNPNGLGKHMHRIFGSSNFKSTYDFDDYRSAECSSIGIQADKSAYWVPQLYWMNHNNNGTTYTAIDAGVRIYYRLERDDEAVPVIAFPPGLRMLVGSPDDKEMKYGMQHQYVCQTGMDFSKNLYGNDFNFPRDCPQGLKAVIIFPPCWDGENLYKEDGSHMAYAGSGRSLGQNCPMSHPFRLPAIIFEIIYKPSEWGKATGKPLNGNLIWSSGDTTGYGLHGDFVNGWDHDVLTKALNDDRCTRTGLPGSTATHPMPMKACPVLAASYDDAKARSCKVADALLEDTSSEDLVEIPHLAGCNLPWGSEGTKPKCDDGSFTPTLLSALVATDQPLVVDAKYKLAKDLPTTGVAAPFNCVASDHGILEDEIAYNDNKLSASKCAANCLLSGFRYSATTPPGKCMCGTAVKPLVQSYPADCTFKCPGDSSEACGAGSRSSIWYTPVSVPMPKTIDGSCYIPPYTESQGFQGAAEYKSPKDEKMTGTKCKATCKEKGFKWAATQAFYTCMCGDEWRMGGGHFETEAQSSCVTPCGGDKSQICGTDMSARLVVYDLTGNVMQEDAPEVSDQTTSDVAEPSTSGGSGVVPSDIAVIDGPSAVGPLTSATATAASSQASASESSASDSGSSVSVARSAANSGPTAVAALSTVSDKTPTSSSSSAKIVNAVALGGAVASDKPKETEPVVSGTVSATASVASSAASSPVIVAPAYNSSVVNITSVYNTTASYNSTAAPVSSNNSTSGGVLDGSSNKPGSCRIRTKKISKRHSARSRRLAAYRRNGLRDFV